MNSGTQLALGSKLEWLYRRYNRREFVHPDPLEFLYRYDDPRDREIAGLVASSLAYGRVKQILASVGAALEVTDAFRELAPRDPVRYDFALTRLGIRDDADADGFLKSCGVEGGFPKEIRRWN